MAKFAYLAYRQCSSVLVLGGSLRILQLFISLICVLQYVTLTIACSNQCNLNGWCENTKCICFDGFTGGSCEERICPGGRAWFDVATGIDTAHAISECSNAGLCDRTSGRCKCKPGFEGASCSRMACPGNSNCNGHGRCFSMSEAAAERDDVTLFVDTTYDTWDADMIVGCVCDVGYEGFDCSLRTCEKGDDILTTSQFSEIQTIECGSGGSDSAIHTFALKFRGQTTATIAYDATASELKAALEGISSIGEVTVTLLTGTSVCDENQLASVTFVTEHGDVPLMEVKNKHASLSITIYDAIDSTPPVLLGAEVPAQSDGVLVAIFSRELDLLSSSVSPWEVKVNSTIVQSLSNVDVSGTAVTLTLLNKVTHWDSNVIVSYTKPLSYPRSQLTDTSGNLVADISGTSVTNNMVSEDDSEPVPFNVIIPGDKVDTIVLTFQDQLNSATGFVALASQFSVEINGNAVTGITSATTEGSTVTLVLTSTTILASDDVVVTYTAPTDGTARIEDSYRNPRTTNTFTSAINYIIGPTFIRADVLANAPTKVIITYNRSLSTVNTADASDFVVDVEGTSATISTLSYLGPTVELTLSSAIVAGQTVTVQYTMPADSNRTQDTSGSPAATLNTTNVQNNIAQPTLVSAEIPYDSTTSLILTFNSKLHETNPSDGLDWTVTVDSSTATITSVTTSGTSITIVLDSPVISGEVVTISYTDNSDANFVRDTGTNPLSNFSNVSVTNNAPIPVLIYATSPSGGSKTLVLIFDHELHETNIPEKEDFTITIGSGAAINPESLSVSETTVVLTMTDVVLEGQSIAFTYTKSNSSTDILQDTSGNVVADIDSSTHAVSYVNNVVNLTLRKAYIPANSPRTIHLIFNSKLKTSQVLQVADFSPIVGGVANSVIATDINEVQLTLYLTNPIHANQVVTLSWSTTSYSSRIVDEQSNPLNSLSSQSVENLINDIFISAIVPRNDAHKIVLNYSRMLDTINYLGSGICVTGQIGTTAIATSSDNSEAGCRAVCALSSACHGFDYTTTVDAAACRLVGYNSHTTDGGVNNRMYCEMGLSAISIVATTHSGNNIYNNNIAITDVSTSNNQVLLSLASPFLFKQKPKVTYTGPSGAQQGLRIQSHSWTNSWQSMSDFECTVANGGAIASIDDLTGMTVAQCKTSCKERYTEGCNCFTHDGTDCTLLQTCLPNKCSTLSGTTTYYIAAAQMPGKNLASFEGTNNIPIAYTTRPTLLHSRINDDFANQIVLTFDKKLLTSSPFTPSTFTAMRDTLETPIRALTLSETTVTIEVVKSFTSEEVVTYHFDGTICAVNNNSHNYSSSAEGTECVFPFTYNSVEYFAPTIVDNDLCTNESLLSKAACTVKGTCTDPSDTVGSTSEVNCGVCAASSLVTQATCEAKGNCTAPLDTTGSTAEVDCIGTCSNQNLNNTSSATCTDTGTCNPSATVAGCPVDSVGVTQQENCGVCTNTSKLTQALCTAVGTCTAPADTVGVTSQSDCVGSCTNTAYNNTDESTCINKGTCTFASGGTAETEQLKCGVCSNNQLQTESSCTVVGTCTLLNNGQDDLFGFTSAVNCGRCTRDTHETSAHCLSKGKCAGACDGDCDSLGDTNGPTCSNAAYSYGANSADCTNKGQCDQNSDTTGDTLQNDCLGTCTNTSYNNTDESTCILKGKCAVLNDTVGITSEANCDGACSGGGTTYHNNQTDCELRGTCDNPTDTDGTTLEGDCTGTWTQNTYTAATWEVNTWTASTWTQNTWTASTCSGDWQVNTWQAGTFTLNTWSGGTWNAHTWTDGVYSANQWTAGTFSVNVWTAAETWVHNTWTPGTWTRNTWTENVEWCGTAITTDKSTDWGNSSCAVDAANGLFIKDLQGNKYNSVQNEGVKNLITWKHPTIVQSHLSGSSMYIAFNQGLASGYTDTADWTVVGKTVDTVAVSNNVLQITVDSSFSADATFSYTPNNNDESLHSSSGIPCEAIASTVVTYSVPSLTTKLAIIVPADGNQKIWVIYDRPLSTTLPDAESFAITSISSAGSTTYPTVSSISVIAECTIQLSFSTSLESGASISVTYTATNGNINTGSVVDNAIDFTNASATNYIQTDTSEPILKGIEVPPNNPKSIIIEYNEDILSRRACTFSSQDDKILTGVASVKEGKGYKYKQCQFLCCSDILCKSFDYNSSNAGTTTVNCKTYHVASGDTDVVIDDGVGWTHSTRTGDSGVISSEGCYTINRIATPVLTSTAVRAFQNLVYITLDNAVNASETVTLTYTPSDVGCSSKIKDDSSNEAAAFSQEVVVNNTDEVSTPTKVSAYVPGNDGTVVLIEYDATLLTSSVPDPAAFDVQVDGVSKTVASPVEISTTLVKLTLASHVIKFGEVVTLSYTVPSSNKLQSVEESLALEFSSSAVVNYFTQPSTLDRFVPSNNSANLVILYNSIPAYSLKPDAADYSITKNSSVSVSSSSLAMSGPVSIISTSSNFVYGDVVTCQYTNNGNSNLFKGGMEMQDASDEVSAASVQNFLRVGPSFVLSYVVKNNYDSLVVLYDDSNLSTANNPESDFAVTVSSSPVTVNSISASGNTLTLGFTRDIGGVITGEEVKVEYTCCANGSITGSDGNPVTVSVQTTAATNYVSSNSLISTFLVANANSDVVLQFSHKLNTSVGYVALASDFAVVYRQNNTSDFLVSATISSATTAGNTITLSLSSPLRASVEILVTYTPPTSGTARIQSTLGNSVEAFSSISATNYARLSELYSQIPQNAPSTLYIQFDHILDESTDADTSPWYVEYNLYGNPITSINITKSLVTISLTYSIPSGDVVTYNYKMPNSDFLYADPSDIRLRNYVLQPVTNNSEGPVVSNAIVTANQHDTIVVFFKSSLDIVNVASAADFLVTVTKNGVSSQVVVTSISTYGTSINLTILRTIMQGETVTCSYTRPSIGGIRDSDGNLAGSFTSQSVTNFVPAEVGTPVMRRKYIPGNKPYTIIISFNEYLDSSNTALPADFTIKVNSVVSTASSVHAEGTQLIVTHATQVTEGDSVTIEYTKPASGINFIQDISANEYSSFAEDTVTNYTTSLHGAVEGTKETSVCNNRGKCNSSTGQCACDAGFSSSDKKGGSGTLNDCGYHDGSSVTCPTNDTLKICSGNGICSGSPDYTCNCFEGFQGYDCSEFTCPKGRAWFDEATGHNEAHAIAECSNRGYCNRSNGTCRCYESEGEAVFEGDACELLACPNRIHYGIPCSGHGKCVTMSQAASKRNINGVLSATVYGSSRKSFLSWDAHKIRGCICESSSYTFAAKDSDANGEVPGYTSYDCRAKVCPYGPFPGDNNCGGLMEKQTFICKATSGSFTLTFREQTTAAIAFDADAAAVRIALQALRNIGSIIITFDTGTAACTSDGSNTTTVEFVTELGDVPTLSFSTSLLVHSVLNAMSFSIQEDTKGTKLSYECSNSGVCNRSTGECKCYDGYTSSDGFGLIGRRADCGHISSEV